MTWATGYLEPFSDLSAITAEALEHRKHRTSVSSTTTFTPTVSRMTPEELNAVIYPAAMACNPTPFDLPTGSAVYRPNLERAVFDTKGEWQSVEIIMLWADMSDVYCVWSARSMSDLLQEPVPEGQHRRKVRLVKLERANHVVSPTFLARFDKADSTVPVALRGTRTIHRHSCRSDISVRVDNAFVMRVIGGLLYCHISPGHVL